MSDQAQVIERWEAPFFEQPDAHSKRLDTAELEALAQSRGFQAGKWEGLESGRAEAEKMVNQMVDLLDDMVKPYRSLDHLVTQELANLSMLIARQIIRRELSISSELVVDMTREALSTISSLEGEIEISIHPSDVEMVYQVAEKNLHGKAWKLIPDPNYLPGGCRVKTPVSFVDATIEKQIEMTLAGLMDACEHEPG